MSIPVAEFAQFSRVAIRMPIDLPITIGRLAIDGLSPSPDHWPNALGHLHPIVRLHRFSVARRDL